MYAQLGDIVFEAMTGFTSVGETDEASIARYETIAGKPYAAVMAGNLRELTVGMRLHQKFVHIKEARMKLRTYKDGGTPVSLIWGNGDIEGRFLVSGISTNIEDGDALGNVHLAAITVTLLEAPDNKVLEAKAIAAYSKAVGLQRFGAPQVAVVPPKKPTELAKFLAQYKKVMKYAKIIDALSYGGSFPYMGQTLGQVIGNADANLSQLGDLYVANPGLFDTPNLIPAITGMRATLSSMAVLDPLTDPVGFAMQNGLFQARARLFSQSLWTLQVRALARMIMFKKP
jgi:Phage P2 GpU